MTLLVLISITYEVFSSSNIFDETSRCRECPYHLSDQLPNGTETTRRYSRARSCALLPAELNPKRHGDFASACIILVEVCLSMVVCVTAGRHGGTRLPKNKTNGERLGPPSRVMSVFRAVRPGRGRDQVFAVILAPDLM